MFVAAGDSLSGTLLVCAAPFGGANRRGPDAERGAAHDCAGVGGREDTRAARLAAVAEQVRAIQARHRPEGTRHATGLAALDALLDGGFAEGAIHELVAGKEAAAVDAVAWRAASTAAGAPCGIPTMQSPGAAVIDVQRASGPFQASWFGGVAVPSHPFALLPPHRPIPAHRDSPACSVAAAPRRWLVYIDSAASLFPPALALMGVPLERLLVVRVSRVTDVLWTFEQCLRCRAVAAVIAPLRELDAYISRRLQLAAEQGGSLGFLLRPDVHVGHTFAATRLRFDPIESATSVRRLRVTPLKLRGGGVREPVIVELCDAAHAVFVDAIPVDRASVARRRAIG